MSPKQVFVREATGLVREVGFWSAMVYNSLTMAPGLLLAYELWWIPGTFPGGSIVWAMVIGCIISILVCSTFGIMSMAFPRTSADYVAVGRVLHPGLAFGSSLSNTLGCLLSIGAWSFAWTEMALTPTLSVIGISTGNLGLVGLAGTVSTMPWNFLIGLVGLFLTCAWVAAGMRRIMILQNILFAIAMIGILIMGAILVSTPQSVFITQFNSFAQPFTKQADSYHYIIQQAAAQGMQYPGTYSFTATMSILPAILALGLFTWWGVAQTGEIKGASTRGPWYGMVLATVMNFSVCIVMIVLLFNTIGEQFLSAANYLYSVAPNTYALPVAPSLPLLVSLIPGGILLPWLTVLSFMAWAPLILLTCVLQPPRAFFAWAFDRLLPSKVTEVSDRTHSPLIALAIVGAIGVAVWTWATAGVGFFPVLILATASGFQAILFIGITAVIFPFLKREQYRSSPAKIEVAGIPIVSITGAVSVIAALWLCYMYFTDPRLGLTNGGTGAIFTATVPILGVLYYYIIRAYRRRQGIDLSLVFKEIPPE